MLNRLLTSFDYIQLKKSLKEERDKKIYDCMKYCIYLCMITCIIMGTIFFHQKEGDVYKTAFSCHSILLYLLMYQTKTHLKYIGGYFTLLIGILEGLYLNCEFSVGTTSVDTFCIATACMSIVSLSYTDINWKLKSIFFMAGRTMIIIIYEIR
jgi:hypothetical protein